MKRIVGLLTGLAAGLLFCACGAGDEEVPGAGEPAASEDRASEQAEAAQSTDDLDADDQTASVPTSGTCFAECSMLSLVNMTGICCSCNGVTRTYRRSPVNPNLYLCL